MSELEKFTDLDMTLDNSTSVTDLMDEVMKIPEEILNDTIVDSL